METDTGGISTGGISSGLKFHDHCKQSWVFAGICPEYWTQHCNPIKEWILMGVSGRSFASKPTTRFW